MDIVVFILRLPQQYKHLVSRANKGPLKLN